MSHDHNEGKLLEINDALEAELTRLRVYETLYKKEVEENAKLREALERILNYVPEGFISPMDDDDTLNFRIIARNALKETT